MADPDDYQPIPTFKITDDLTRAAGVLQDMQSQGEFNDYEIPNSPPALFGAGGPMLKQFDESTFASRIGSQAATPPQSVKGIGGKVAKPDYSESKIVLAMVGLPARGKSYLSNKLMIYLKWLEYDVKVQVFNVGQLRRTRAKQKAKQSGIKEDHTAQWFSHENQNANESREQLAHDSLEMLIQWLKDGGNVGIHDATNSTRSRRASIEARVAKEKGFLLIFLESLCDDPAVIAANVALKIRSGDPDYEGMDPEKAKQDFLTRIKEYEKVYETITEPHLSYLRIVNVGSEVTMSRINGYLSSRIAFYLMNLHLNPRSIYLSRVREIHYAISELYPFLFPIQHGESQFNVEGKIGGDSLLSPRGLKYAEALPALVTDNIGDAPLTVRAQYSVVKIFYLIELSPKVWTSTLRRTIQTGQHLPYPKLTWKSLDELDAGVCDGMTYEEIEQAYPEDFANRDDDKFNYRYRGGESYRDVVVRLEPVIMELERQENILIIGHQAILRCLYAYFHYLPQADLPYIKIPLHTVIKLTPRAYGCDEERLGWAPRVYGALCAEKLQDKRLSPYIEKSLDGSDSAHFEPTCLLTVTISAMSSTLRVLSSSARAVSRTSRPAPVRAFHSPFAALGNSPLLSSTPTHPSAVYEKQYDFSPEVLHGARTVYVVSEPDASSKHYSVPSGAYPTSSPYINFASTEAPNSSGTQVSSTSSSLFAHTQTICTVPTHPGGVGESASVRHAWAPGDMEAGSDGGLGLMDAKGTIPPQATPTDRNPPPDGAMAEIFSKMGIDEAWKLRK
ncbi:hypothetical protein H0H87_009951 [Tephrocybe sp. NHM501043]|nr:hypothetical protein H0H87_009951 [Tephrocybe sp. NHM501043]